MQVIDDVGASDGSVRHGDDDVISRHSGSDFEDMSSFSGSFSRSRSPLSRGSRSRSGSAGSSGRPFLFVACIRSIVNEISWQI